MTFDLDLYLQGHLALALKIVLTLTLTLTLVNSMGNHGAAGGYPQNAVILVVLVYSAKPADVKEMLCQIVVRKF